jgi:hypothetical protein
MSLGYEIPLDYKLLVARSHAIAEKVIVENAELRIPDYKKLLPLYQKKWNSQKNPRIKYEVFYSLQRRRVIVVLL